MAFQSAARLADFGIHLKVADLELALGFWRDVLRFGEQARSG